MKSIAKAITFTVAILTLAACNKTTSNDSSDPTVKTEKTTTVVYPHDKDFYKKHGANYLQNKDQCLGCHGKDGSGGTANVSCLQCHQGFPHAQNWVMPDQHPVQFVKSPQSCASCHGEDWKGGKSQVSCLQCHQGFPHPLQWAAPENHGKTFVATKDKKQCLNCHDQNKNPSLATRCDTCHKAFPHDKSFVVGGKVHQKLGATYEGKCLNCHKDYKENMPNYQDPDEGLGCFGCHEGKIEIRWMKEEPPTTTLPGPSGLKAKKTERMPTSSPHKKTKKKTQ